VVLLCATVFVLQANQLHKSVGELTTICSLTKQSKTYIEPIRKISCVHFKLVKIFCVQNQFQSEPRYDHGTFQSILISHKILERTILLLWDQASSVRHTECGNNVVKYNM